MNAVKRTTRTLWAWAFGIALLVPAVASAQSLAGVVKDTSGAVLPGVTVEASSPALIERTRSTVTDDRGQYRAAMLTVGSKAVAASGSSTLITEVCGCCRSSRSPLLPRLPAR